MSLIERIHNTETNEIIERELTKSEIKDLQDSRAESLAKESETNARVEARKNVLVKLGLTEEEINLLF